jgi:hypothetical protein
MLLFLRFRASQAGIFSDLFMGESCPLRIPVLRKKRPEGLAAVSPIDKSRKYEALPTVTKKKEHSLFGLFGNP